MRPLLFLFVLAALIPLPATAQTESAIQAFGTEVVWTTPDTLAWHLDESWIDEERRRGLVMYKREPIADYQGTLVAPVMALVIELLSEPVDVITYALHQRINHGWQKKHLHAPGTATTFENAVVFDAQRSQGGRDHSLILGFMIHDQTAVQVICDSTEGVFDQVEHDMREFVRSLTIESRRDHGLE